MNKLIFCVLVLYLNGVLSNSCEKHTTCRECIRDASLCVWCASKTYNSDQRCKPKSGYGNRPWCPDPLDNPQSIANATQIEPFSSNSTHVTQITPQRYQLNLRPGEPTNFSFSFKWAEDYPVDIYFLFDSSKTMKMLRNHTSQQSENIYNTTYSMTKNVYMGMGTFVDKNMLPYATNFTVKDLSYSFRHRLNLTQDYKKFQEAVDAIPQGENRDLPEAGLDALAQAIACKDEIGWRNQSRKILVLMTDDSYHAAGDGRSAGIFKPYDGKCYTKNNIYTKELEMDYPSISMINKLATDNHVIVIFAVSDNKNTRGVYTGLDQYITGSKTVTLDVTSKTGDIVTKLKEIYEEITTKIKLNVKMQTDPSGSARLKDFLISFDPDCSKDLSACNVTRNDVKNINGTIQLLEYVGYDKAVIDVAIEGIAEKVTLDINITNNCKCEMEGESKSTHCNNEKWECGICQCNEPRYGDKCQCNRETIGIVNNTSTCQTENITKPCSGRGLCSCGACSCLPGYAGPYCECFLENCPMDKNHVVCGGHGECQCDETCKCEPGWSGDACECYGTDKLCLAPNNKVCNNRGKCNCGHCMCEPIAPWDMRKDQNDFCVINPCPECHSPQCKILSDCAICLRQEKNTVKDCNCSIVQNNLAYMILDKLPDNVNDSDDYVDWHICTVNDIGCYTNFAYKYDEDQYRIYLKLETYQNCAKNYLIFGGVFLLTLLLVGVCTLLVWKWITYLRDRQEYLQFMKDHVPDDAPCDNPLYEPATTEFKNPVFGKRNLKY